MIHAFFILGYVLLFLILVSLLPPATHDRALHVSALDFVLLCLATFRLTQVVCEERIARWIRAPFVQRRAVVGAGGTPAEEEVPWNSGLRRVAGELVLCPWCLSVWIATLLTFFHVLLPGIAHVFLLALAVAAGGMILQVGVKMMDRVRQDLSGASQAGAE